MTMLGKAAFTGWLLGASLFGATELSASPASSANSLAKDRGDVRALAAIGTFEPNGGYESDVAFMAARKASGDRTAHRSGGAAYHGRSGGAVTRSGGAVVRGGGVVRRGGGVVVGGGGGGG